MYRGTYVNCLPPRALRGEYLPDINSKVRTICRKYGISDPQISLSTRPDGKEINWEIKFKTTPSNYSSVYNDIRAIVDVLKDEDAKYRTEHTYTVNLSESWWGIAQKLLGDGDRADELATWNGMSASSKLYTGTKLLY
jgi:hypothetical protein